jgi:hypothetical protein
MREDDRNKPSTRFILKNRDTAWHALVLKKMFEDDKVFAMKQHE